jgi:protein SCO1
MSALTLVRYSAWATIGLLAVVIGFLLLNPSKRSDQPAGGRIGGQFQIAQAKGGILDSNTLKGKPYALFFGFTQCPDICPGTLLDFTTLMDEVDKGPLAEKAKDFRMFFVTVDPERDTPELMTSYLSAFDARVTGLVPSLEHLPALAKQFAAFYSKVPTSSGYTMNHTSAVYLFNSDGVFSGTIDTQETRANQKAKLARLLGG